MIYRSVGKFGPSEYVASKDHNDTTCTDETWTNGGYELLYYDVRAYHTPSQTSADEGWRPTYGTINMQKGGGDKKPVLESQMVKAYSVGCYPNPFNPSTTISFALVENADVKLDIYDMTGRRIAALFDGESSAGIHSVVWNGRDQSGISVSSGLYFYRFRSVSLNGQKPFVKTGKLILMK